MITPNKVNGKIFVGFGLFVQHMNFHFVSPLRVYFMHHYGCNGLWFSFTNYLISSTCLSVAFYNFFSKCSLGAIEQIMNKPLLLLTFFI